MTQDLRQRLIALLERIERDDQMAEYAPDCELAACLAALYDLDQRVEMDHESKTITVHRGEWRK